MADGISHNWDEECKAKNSDSAPTTTAPIFSTATLQYGDKFESQAGLVMVVVGFALGFVAAYALMLLAAGKKERPKNE